MSLAQLLKDSVSVTRASEVADGQGGFTETYEAVATVKGRVWPMNAHEQRVAAEQRAEATHAVVLRPRSTDVQVEDRLVIAGRTYRVTVPDLTPSKPIFRKVLTVEVSE